MIHSPDLLDWVKLPTLFALTNFLLIVQLSIFKIVARLAKYIKYK